MEPKFAYVAYTDVKFEILPTSNIFHDKKKTQPFEPKDEEDYIPNEKYWCVSAVYFNIDGSHSKAKAYVCRLGGKNALGYVPLCLIFYKIRKDFQTT